MVNLCKDWIIIVEGVAWLELDGVTVNLCYEALIVTVDVEWPRLLDG